MKYCGLAAGCTVVINMGVRRWGQASEVVTLEAKYKGVPTNGAIG